MILIQLVLIMVLVSIGVNFIRSRQTTRTRAFKKLLLLMTLPSAIFVVLFPSYSTKLANLLGVGRGADLLLYGLTVMVIFQFFDRYIKSFEEQRRLAVLARKLAIMEAQDSRGKSS